MSAEMLLLLFGVGSALMLTGWGVWLASWGTGWGNQ